MSGRPWYKRYPADFLHGTSMLSCEEKGAYSVALDLMYDRGGPIPDDAGWLARMCGCTVRKWSQVLRPALLAAGKLRICGDGMLSNGRMEYETQQAAEAVQVARQSGKRGGRPKKAQPGDKSQKKYVESGIFNDLAKGSGSVEEAEPGVNSDPAIIEPIISAQSNEIKDIDSDTLLRPADRAAAATDVISGLSSNYRLDKSEIIETKPFEIKAPPKADSETQSLEVRKKERTSLAGGSASASAPAPPRDRASRLPADWRVSDAEIAFGISVGFSRQAVELMADRFADHFHAKGGQHARKVDWTATWRNWVREDQRREGAGAGRRHAYRASPIEQARQDWGCGTFLAPIIDPEPDVQSRLIGASS
jgi:uncharacterized protein YdaU (DUF1376 family)